MKRFLVVLLAVTVFANISKADNTLIYVGTDKEFTEIYHEYILFDLDTLQVLYVGYSDLKSQGKRFSTFGPLSFNSSPTNLKPPRTQSVFVYGAISASAHYQYQFAIFEGMNSLLSLGGTFTGEYPKTLSFKEYSVSGSGTTGTDSQYIDTGAFHIDLALTQAANSANDDLSDATTVISNALVKLGYVHQ